MKKKEIDKAEKKVKPRKNAKVKTQSEIFQTLYRKYSPIFPDMLHGSGGLPDVHGKGTSDVDICVKHDDYANLLDEFPKTTKVDHQDGRSVYTLVGYEREANFYITNGDWWDNAHRHRIVQLELNKRFPELSEKAAEIKKEEKIGTEAAWAKVLGLGDNYMEEMFDMDTILSLASKKSD